MPMCDWSSDVCSSDLTRHLPQRSIRCYTHHAPWQKLSASPLSPSPTAHNRTSVASSDSTSTFPTSVHLSQSRVAALVRADVHISGMTLTSPWWVSLIPTCSTIQSLGCFQGDPLKHKFPFKALQWLRLALVTTPSLPSTAHPACLPDCTFVPPILPAIFPPGHPTLSLSHRVHKTVLYISVSFAVSYTGLLLPSF